jgi:two-component sensor histidine kinase
MRVPSALGRDPRNSSLALLLLDGDFRLVAASASFCEAFGVADRRLTGLKLSEVGGGEWGDPRLLSLLSATASGDAQIDVYEMDLALRGQAPRRLEINAKRIEYGRSGRYRLLVAILDTTEAQENARKAVDLARQNEVLIQEVRHRVANSLQIIASVLMQNARRSLSEETRLHLNDARQRVLSIAELQQQLANSTQGEVDIRTYLTRLCETIGASMIAEPERLVLAVTAPSQVIDAGLSVSLGLIVTELVINALKHAFPDDHAGRIVVDYRLEGQGWRLSVRDDGVGMPTLAEGRTPGLGSSIVEALARQYGARVEILDAAPGTEVAIIANGEA